MKKTIKLNRWQVQLYKMYFKELPDNMCAYKARWILIIITSLLFPSIFLFFILRMNKKINNLYLWFEAIGGKDGELLLGSAIIINFLASFLSLIYCAYCPCLIRIRYVLLIANETGIFLGLLFMLTIILSIIGIEGCYKYFRKKTKKYCAKIRVEDGFYVKIKEPVMEEK